MFKDFFRDINLAKIKNGAGFQLNFFVTRKPDNRLKMECVLARNQLDFKLAVLIRFRVIENPICNVAILHQTKFDCRHDHTDNLDITGVKDTPTTTLTLPASPRHTAAIQALVTALAAAGHIPTPTLASLTMASPTLQRQISWLFYIVLVFCCSKMDTTKGKPASQRIYDSPLTVRHIWLAKNIVIKLVLFKVQMGGVG